MRFALKTILFTSTRQVNCELSDQERSSEMSYIVATIRSDDWREVKVIAMPEKKWRTENTEGTITSLWSVGAVGNASAAIACVIENAIGIGNTVSCIRPQRRDRRYLLEVMHQIKRTLFGDGTGTAESIISDSAQMATEAIIKAEGLENAR